MSNPTKAATDRYMQEWMHVSIPSTPARACNCVGPRPGDPVCPCRMSALTVRNGRWVEVIDHGPAAPSHTEAGE